MSVWEKHNGLIMATLAGSHLYGTSRPDSDIDIRGVCFPPRNALLGLQGLEQYQPKGSSAVEYVQRNFRMVGVDDVTIYALSKFFSLCLNANPNIIELLFADQAIIHYGYWWCMIVNNRNLFLSTKIVHSFAGYAYSQLKRIQTHKRWLDSPPEQPNPYRYGLQPPNKKKGANVWVSESRKREYQQLRREFENYWTWRENRNPARAKLEKAHGYDTKHAAHLYRLLCEAEELLLTGHLTLPLKPEYRDEYFYVLNGGESYEQVVADAESAKDDLLEMEARSPLPKRPNHSAAEELLMEMHWAWLKKQED